MFPVRNALMLRANAPSWEHILSPACFEDYVDKLYISRTNCYRDF